MEEDVGFEIKGLDAYPELKVKKKFPFKKHMLVECPRHGGLVDVVFSRKDNPMCLQVLDKDECDLCWAFNLTRKKEIFEARTQRILEEYNYWQSLRVKYRAR